MPFSPHLSLFFFDKTHLSLTLAMQSQYIFPNSITPPITIFHPTIKTLVTPTLRIVGKKLIKNISQCCINFCSWHRYLWMLPLLIFGLIHKFNQNQILISSRTFPQHTPLHATVRKNLISNFRHIFLYTINDFDVLTKALTGQCHQFLVTN